ncbi:MAG: histidinol dehydrogenase, partial [Bacteroidia bacterium]|nr:histidinol dehydrogenase [Bacteroidia bacterium]
ESEDNISLDLKQAIKLSYENIAVFHRAQDTVLPIVETMPGVTCWQKAMPIEKVGLYIPGGTAPLFSTVLMLALPAKIAGCREIVLCTPPNAEGKVHPAVLYAAKISGVSKVYVTAAKQLVSLRDVAIDMPAGPSEVEVLADETAVPAFVASDLLSQAEHGKDSQAMLITTSSKLADAVELEVYKQLELLPRKELASVSMGNSKIIVVKNMEEAIEATNEYAPEHLIIATKDYRQISEKIINAGSIFLGNLTPESAGDYASGTNHTLPTNGYAKMYSGVNLDSFRKKITYQEITAEGMRNIGPAIQIMAETESLTAHKHAVTLRMKEI